MKTQTKMQANGRLVCIFRTGIELCVIINELSCFKRICKQFIGKNVQAKNLFRFFDTMIAAALLVLLKIEVFQNS